MRISDWSSDVCSSDLRGDCVDVLARRIDEALDSGRLPEVDALRDEFLPTARSQRDVAIPPPDLHSYNSLIASGEVPRSAEHTSELQSLMRTSYAVFCLKQKTQETAQRRGAYPAPNP